MLKNGRFHHIDKILQAEYMDRHKHIAPELVKGHCKESESSLGFVISEVVRYRPDFTQVTEDCKDVHCRRDYKTIVVLYSM